MGGGVTVEVIPWLGGSLLLSQRKRGLGSETNSYIWKIIGCKKYLESHFKGELMEINFYDELVGMGYL